MVVFFCVFINWWNKHNGKMILGTGFSLFLCIMHSSMCLLCVCKRKKNRAATISTLPLITFQQVSSKFLLYSVFFGSPYLRHLASIWRDNIDTVSIVQVTMDYLNSTCVCIQLAVNNWETKKKTIKILKAFETVEMAFISFIYCIHYQKRLLYTFICISKILILK